MDSSYRVPRKKMDRRLGAQVITVVLAWCWHHLVWGQTDENLDYLRGAGDAGGAGAAQPRVYSIGPFTFLVHVEMSPSTFLVLTKNCWVQTHLTFRMTGDAGSAGAAQPRAARPRG